MRFESGAELVDARIDAAFNAAVDDTLELARDYARHASKSGKFERSLTRTPVAYLGDRLEARIGSPLVSARAKERGAYIVAQNAPYLAIPHSSDGTLRRVPSVRIPPRPVVTPAVRRFADIFRGRLAQTGTSFATVGRRPRK